MSKTEKLAVLALVIALATFAMAFAGWREARAAVGAKAQQAAAPAGEWLTGTPQEQVRTVEKHLRGLDVTMAEIGYRFTELHFAGQDTNWDYAKYQAEKIDLSLRLALERRPKRADSSRPFLNEALPVVQRAIQAKDRAAFRQAMDRLRTACMNCHANEKVPYFTVEFPDHRIAPVRTIR